MFTLTVEGAREDDDGRGESQDPGVQQAPAGEGGEENDQQETAGGGHGRLAGQTGPRDCHQESPSGGDGKVEMSGQGCI